MQDEIVVRLARALDVELTAAEARRAERSPSVQPDALDLTFRGWAAYNRGVKPGSLLPAKRFFEQALALDPANVEAYVGLATIDFHFAATYSTDDRASYLAAAETAATKALALIAPR
jgi:hypothetical protein